ncbi:hypothetical protein ACQ859_19490 [Roseateles chitinivorans]|uniref:hypothetical protein n=1 Tax=Roseateles chitinivorans TaxID=2917965 RepID=UPI003D670455
MPRFNRSLTLWTFALLVASVLLAWPLHEAKHASQPIADIVGASAISADGGGSDVAADVSAATDAFAFDDHGNTDGVDGGGAGEVKGGSCAWCLFHAQLFAASATPLVFSFHAEASPPPIAPTCGLPTGRCALAAHPRGPPRA